MYSLKKQRGMTGLGWLTILFLIGFFAYVGLKLVPIYLEHYSIKDVVESVGSESGAGKKPISELRKNIIKRLKINGIYRFNRDYMKFKKAGGVLTIAVTYNVEEHMGANIYLLVKFEEQIEVPIR